MMPVRSSESQRPYNVRYYATHRQAELDRVKTRQEATLAFLRGLRQVPCDDCRGVFPPHMMDFDHRDPSKKLFTLAGGHALLMSRDKLIAEVEKCDVVCANCHALRTFGALMTVAVDQLRRSGPQARLRISRVSARIGVRARRCWTCLKMFRASIAADGSRHA